MQLCANVTSDLVLGLLFTSATLAGLVVVFLATASNQIKVFLSENKLATGFVSVPMKYIATQYLLLEWAALIAFGILTAAFVFGSLIILPAAVYADPGDVATKTLKVTPWLPRLGLAMVVYGVEVIFASLVAMVSNDEISVKRIISPTFDYKRKPTATKIAKFLAVCLGISVLAFLLLYSHLNSTGQSPRASWSILKIVLWVVTGPGLLAWMTVLWLYWKSGYVDFAREAASETDVYAIVRSTANRVLLCKVEEAWCFPAVHFRDGGGSNQARETNIRNRVSSLFPAGTSIQVEPEATAFRRSIKGLVPPYDNLINEAYLYYVGLRDNPQGLFPDNVQLDQTCGWFEIDQIPENASEALKSAIPILTEQGTGEWRELSE